MQAFSSSKEGEDAYAKIREALDSIDNKPLTSECRASMNRPQEQVNGNLAHHNQLSSSTTEPAVNSDSSVSHLHTDTDKNETQVPSEVITSCVATLLMIQVSPRFWTQNTCYCFQPLTHTGTHVQASCFKARVEFFPVIKVKMINDEQRT